MTKQEIELLFLLHLKGPQSMNKIQSFVTTDLVHLGYVWWMPTDGGRVALALTPKGEKWAKEALRIVKENFDC